MPRYIRDSGLYPAPMFSRIGTLDLNLQGFPASFACN